MKKIFPLTLAVISVVAVVLFLLRYFVFSDPVGVALSGALNSAMIVPVLIWFMAPYSTKYDFTPRQAHISGGICLGLLMVIMFMIDYLWLGLSIRETLLDVFLAPIVMFFVMWMLDRFGLFSSLGKTRERK